MEDFFEDLYENFVDDQKLLHETFTNMTEREFHEFLGYVISRHVRESREITDLGRLCLNRALILAMASKLLEFAHFESRLSDDERIHSRRLAITTFEVAKRLYPPDLVPAVEKAWAASLEEADRFGWPSVVFDILAGGRKIFRDP